MKKIILLIGLFLCISSINAQEYWSDEILNDESKYIAESEIRYKFYKNEVIDSFYEIYNEKYKNEYDMNDYIESDYLPWSENKIGNTSLETRFVVKRFDTKIFNYIVIHNFKSYGLLMIEDIKVRNIKTDEILNYETIYENLNDGSNANSDYTKIILEFEDFYNVKDVEIIVTYYSNVIPEQSFDLSFAHDRNNYTASKTIKFTGNNYTCKGNCLISIKENNFNTRYDYFVKEYRYKDVLYKRNINEKVYAEGYYNELEGYIKDYESAKIFYKYSDKISNIVIDNNIEEVVVKEENNQLALKTNKQKVEYNNYLIFGSLFVIIGTVLLALIEILKKLIKKVV